MEKKEFEGLSLLGSGETQYPSCPEKAQLETFPNPYPNSDYTITFDCPEFTSVCPKTAQPDFGRLVIKYIPRQKCLESKSLKLYLFSFRNVGAFWEETIGRIANDLNKVLSPEWIVVEGYMNVRGGITIQVVSERHHNICGDKPE